MILILLLEVRNLKKYNKIDNNNNSKNNSNSNNNEKITTIKVVLIIKLIAPRRQEIAHRHQVEKLNGFLLTQKLNHKCLVKVRTFNSAKVRCIHDHAKPTV